MVKTISLSGRWIKQRRFHRL